MKKQKMIIEIKGGNVLNVFTDVDVDIQIKDHDLESVGENYVTEFDSKPLKLYAISSQQFEH